MAKVSTDEKDDADLDEAKGSAEDRGDAESSEEDAATAEERASDGEGRVNLEKDSESTSLAVREPSSNEGSNEGDEEEEESAAQLGTQRYVLASFFAAGLIGAFILGKMLHGLWAWVANKDWFHNALPWLAAVDDDSKTTYTTIVGAIVAVVLVVRTYRKAGVRSWADEVATELTKVKWPTRKEVSSSTVVVIAASAVATIYLALLDQLWSFVTDLFYGTGS